MRTRHVVDGFLSGSHRNLDPGTSTEYSQHRQYAPGDDLRHVDWKAYGRTDRIYVKQFLDETNLACTFLLDASASMGYRGQRSPLTKIEFASCLVASLAWLVRQQGDAVGISVCNGLQDIHLPPAATEHQLVQLIQKIDLVKAGGDRDIGLAIRDWGIRTDHRQMVVIVSDFFGDGTNLHKSLIDLRQFGHEVILFQVCDRDEVDFPFDRFTEFRSMESNGDVTLDAEVYRSGYLRKFHEFQQEMKQVCSRSSIDFVSLVSDESLGTALGHFLMTRERHA